MTGRSTSHEHTETQQLSLSYLHEDVNHVRIRGVVREAVRGWAELRERNLRAVPALRLKFYFFYSRSKYAYF